ncbi:hypothetical protein AgCh_007721 [Apium graveolens]
MGYMLNSLGKLKTLDLSGNNFHDAIPYQLPPNLTSLDLSSNNFSGDLPASVDTLSNLSTLLASVSPKSDGILP